ncbi:hypothetical protein RTBOTA2_002342 [Rhodotorula toruloides]|uniref:Uncharacterized protein n=1 Tax=Rhodotorula toruloides TaxID=5286 RepID=A0A0K3CA40_RHOTO|nr:hypothetical protein RTBOTA2_002342 [Rhodotorula toruloides]PRQ74766.1 hypothetical protein AAT19DRAFT_13788 [Rhodotorula toruloides]
MFRLPYEHHRGPLQGSIASGLRAVHHAAVSQVPEGHDDMVVRLENGWKGLRDVKGFRKELEVRINEFIMKVDKSESEKYKNSVPGASEPWKGEILFPSLKKDGSPKDPIAVLNAEILQNVECNNAQVPVATIPAGNVRHPVSIKRENDAPADEWHYRRGFMNERGGFSFTLWTLRYTGPEGERFFDVMFAERHSGPMPPNYGVSHSRPSAPPRPSLSRDAPPGYTPPQSALPAYSSPRPSLDTIFRSLGHSRPSSRHSETEAGPSQPRAESARPASRRWSSSAPHGKSNPRESSSAIDAGASSDTEQAVDRRVAGVADRGDFTAVPPAFGDRRQDMHLQVGEWSEGDMDLLETRIRAFLAFYTVRVAGYQWTYRGKTSRDQDVYFTSKLVHGQEPHSVHLVEITAHLSGVWTPIKPEKREATRTIPAFFENSVMLAFALPGATIASNPREEEDDPVHSSIPRVVIPVRLYGGSNKYPIPPAVRRPLQHAPDDIWDFSSRTGPLLPGAEMPHLPLRTTWTVHSADSSRKSPTIVVHFAKDDKHFPIASELAQGWTTFSLGSSVLKGRKGRRERERRAFE